MLNPETFALLWPQFGKRQHSKRKKYVPASFTGTEHVTEAKASRRAPLYVLDLLHAAARHLSVVKTHEQRRFVFEVEASETKNICSRTSVHRGIADNRVLRRVMTNIALVICM